MPEQGKWSELPPRIDCRSAHLQLIHMRRTYHQGILVNCLNMLQFYCSLILLVNLPEMLRHSLNVFNLKLIPSNELTRILENPARANTAFPSTCRHLCERKRKSRRDEILFHLIQHQHVKMPPGFHKAFYQPKRR